MALLPNQTVLALNTLYKVQRSYLASDQLAPNIEVVGGFIDIYGAQSLPGAAPANMYKTNTTPFTGIDIFSSIPQYLYLSQNSGTTTSIIVTGLGVTANPVT